MASLTLLPQVVTTVRDEQLLPGGSIPASRMLPHDVPVDVICTPTQVQTLRAWVALYAAACIACKLLYADGCGFPVEAASSLPDSSLTPHYSIPCRSSG